MSDVDHVRLSKAASYHARGTTELPDDLLQESVRRLLDGSRNWPEGVALATFLSNVMRSIASAERQKVKSGPPIVPVESDGASNRVNNVDAYAHNSSAEEVALASEGPDHRLDQLFELFADDEPAFMVLVSRSEGQTAQEIRDRQNLSLNSYATIGRRIRRKIDNAIAKGLLNGNK